MSKKIVEEIVYEGHIEEKKTVSFIWILPLVILAILSWVAYESYLKKGINIVVVFKSAEGLKEGVTTLEYKGLQLGKVTKIDIDNNFKDVRVNILVRNDVAKFVANKNSRFWIRKPTISLTKVDGLSTLISGYKIELSPQFRSAEEYKKSKLRYLFKGLDSKPYDDFLDNGYYITLLSNEKDNVQMGTPIFYNGFQVGEVYSKEFRFEKVFVKAYIYDKFNHLINKSSKFYMNDALNVTYGASGLNIELGSLYSTLVGGITVSTPNKENEKIHKDDVYILYSSKEELKTRSTFTLRFLDATGIDENTFILYKGVKVGKITKIKLNEDFIETEAYIYEKYNYLLSEKTKFFKEEPNVNLDGVKNLGNIIRGNFISVDYKKGKFKNNFEVDSYIKKKQDRHNKIITLYSEDLNSISENSKVYYKNFQVGRVVSTSLTKDMKKVKIRLAIANKYKKLINDKTLFYDINSKLVQLKGLDLDINYEGFDSLLRGGIAIESLNTKARLTKNSFKLYTSYKDIEKLKRTYKKGIFIDSFFTNDFKIKKDMAIVYKNQEIGFIDSITFGENRSKAKLFIYNKYKKYIDKKSRFYKQKKVDINASLNGILFEIDNFTSFLEGSIHLDTESSINQKLYTIYGSYDKLKNSSNSITILFDDVEGLYEEFSQIRYKGVRVGKVTNITLLKNGKIEVKAQIFDDISSFTKKGTIYYLKKPKITFQEIKNIASTVMAVNIGVIKSHKKQKSVSFDGYDSMPTIPHTNEGSIYKVEAHHGSGIKVDAPVYYKNVEIGKVHKIDLSSDASFMLIDCLIYHKYKKFIRTDSRFYDISGINVKFSIFSDTWIEANTFTSIMRGGLMVVTPLEYKQKATIENRFKLIKHMPDGWDSISPSIK
jgi:paraquat-inducible protein B